MPESRAKTPAYVHSGHMTIAQSELLLVLHIILLFEKLFCEMKNFRKVLMVGLVLVATCLLILHFNTR